MTSLASQIIQGLLRFCTPPRAAHASRLDQKVSENNGQLRIHGSRLDQKSLKTMARFAFVRHHRWSTQATWTKKLNFSHGSFSKVG